jgi:hypothetical protein
MLTDVDPKAVIGRAARQPCKLTGKNLRFEGAGVPAGLGVTNWQLRTLKHPLVAYARQANFAAGPQRVDDAGPCSAGDPPAERRSSPTELLEDQRSKRMDFGSTEAAEQAYSHLATLGSINRLACRRREGPCEDEPIPRRTKSGNDRAE